MSEIEKAQEDPSSPTTSKTTTSTTSDEDVDYAVEPTLIRRFKSASFAPGDNKAEEEDDDEEEGDDDVMPIPATLTRATSAPVEGELSPFKRGKRRQNRKSLRQQNPNHHLHSLLPADMQETEETDEASALARAREKRKLLLAKRNSSEQSGEEEDDDDDEEGQPMTPVPTTTTSVPTTKTTTTTIEEEPPLSNTTNLTQDTTTTTRLKNNHPNRQYSSCSSDGSAVKNPMNLDKFFEMEHEQQEQEQELLKTSRRLPPTPPSSPLKFTPISTTTVGTPDALSIAEESLLPYSNNSVDNFSIGGYDASMDDVGTVNSQMLGSTNATALLKGYQERLSKQLLELQQLCEQDNHVDRDDEHSTFTNPDNNTPRNNNNNKTKEESDDDDDSLSDSSGNLLLMTQSIPANLRLTGRSVHVLEEQDDDDDDDESDEEEDQQDENNDADADHDSIILRRAPSDLSQSERVVVEDEGDEEPTANAPASQVMHRATTPKKEGKDQNNKNKALANMKTPKKSNLSSPSHQDNEDEDETSSLEDLYRTDKWGNADMKDDEAKEVIVDEDGNHVSTTAKVVVATVAVVAGFCVRTFSRHR